MLKDISDQDFSATVLKSEKPIAVDFYGPHCGTCVHLAAALDDISGDYEGEIEFVCPSSDALRHFSASGSEALAHQV